MNPFILVKVIDADQKSESQVGPCTDVIADEQSGLNPAWVARSLASVKRMYEDEEYRLSIAKMLS